MRRIEWRLPSESYPSRRRNLTKRRNISFTFILTLCFISLLNPYVLNVSALEATFTPTPDKDTGTIDGPLPASQNQRNSLLEMDKLIASSSNPTEMLQKIAEGNGMTAEELGNILMRNRRDMEMANAGGASPVILDTLPRRIIRIISSLGIIVAKSASSHPRSFILLVVGMIAVISIIISAPRTGLVISTDRSILSAGHTTILSPPTEYLSKHIESDAFQSKKSSLPNDTEAGYLSSLFVDDDLGDGYEHGGQVVSLSKKQKKNLKMVVTARKNIPFEVLLPSDEDLEFIYEKEIEINGNTIENKKKIMESLGEMAWDDAMALAFASADKILTSQRFTEYVPVPKQIRLHSKGENAALVVKSMGDWQRFGIQPLRIVDENNAADCRSIVYHTLNGGHFDGELRITVRKSDDNEEEESNISLTVTMLIPKDGRKMNSRLASSMILYLAESTATSIMTGAKQILARKQQSLSYRGRVKTKASEKRHIAYENLKQMEEMAEDRRRRWQRSNPDAGRYRPSGHMMRSSGGGPAYGH